MITDKIICGLDVGSQSLKASLVKVKRGHRFELLGVCEMAVRGFKKSQVNDLGEFSESIHYAVQDVARKGGVKLKEIQLGVGGHLIEPRYSKAVIPLMDKSSKVITQNDIKKINKQARLLGVKMDEEILHDFPQYFIIDDANKILNPSGLYGRKLGVASLLIVAPTSLVGNIVKGVNQAGYEVANIFFTSLVSAQTTFDYEMKEKGCLLIDIGATTTNILFFKEGFLRHIDILPLGGDHFTDNIASALHLPFELAEGIKKSHAAVLSDDIKAEGDILVKKEDGYITIKRKVVCEAIESEVAKLIGGIQNTLRFSHIQDKLNAGIMMVGGGALLSGLIERVEKTVNLPSRIGKIRVEAAAINHAPVFTASVGLTQMGFLKFVDRPLSPQAPKNLVVNMSNRVRELYEEYF